MSLINRMLQDLDKRSAEGAASHVAHGPVRAVPPPDRKTAKWRILGCMFALAACFIAWQWTQKKISQPGNVASLSEASSPSLKMSSVLHMADSLTWNAPVMPGKMPEKELSNLARNTEHSASEHGATSNAESFSRSRPLASGTKLIADIKLSEPSISRKVAEVPADVTTVDTPANIPNLVRESTPQQRAENAYRKAISLQQQDHVAESTVELEHALQLDPRHSAARQMLVGFMLEGKRQDDAMRKLKEGVNLDPGLTSMVMMLARLQVEHNEVLAAIDTLQRSLPYASDRADYQAFLAALFQRQGWHKDAIELYTSALRKAPQNGVWWMGMGISLQAENRLPQAKDAFAHAKATNTLTDALQAFVDQKLTQLTH